MTLRRVGAHQRCIRPSLSDTRDSHLKGKLAAAVSRGGRSLSDNPVLFETVEVPKKCFTLQASCEDDYVSDTPIRLYQPSVRFSIESGKTTSVQYTAQSVEVRSVKGHYLIFGYATNKAT
uniref:Uncharacterized protein n=1 Tax=Anguilla anguilla TaxID=7936 RepID=A0A0E9X7B8_ANGAN